MRDIAAVSISRGTQLRAKLAVARGSNRKRHARTFLARTQSSPCNAQAEPTFASVAALPDWILADDSVQDLIAKVAALLFHRNAVDAEIDGARLADLSKSVGEDIFDALCDCPPPLAAAETMHLPRPDSLPDIGKDLMAASLPQSLSHRFPGALDAADLAALCDLAVTIVVRHRHLP